ncbi:MAG: carboxypeptidase-like regulatory domain-containing protein, partial [Bacteroidales bacterium]
MRRILFFSIFILMMVNLDAFAQFVRVSGIVVDKESGTPLIAATLRFNTNRDEILGITNDKGLFSMELPCPGSYKLEITYLGFQKLTRDVQCHPGENNFGKLRLMEEAVVLKNTQILGKNMRVRQNADTTIYNADGYKVLAGASGEDLIAKMPGMV